MGYIYKITNKVNNKAYIGQTIDPVQKRWNEHIYAAYREDDNRYYLHRAIKKYGADNFNFEVLEEVPNEQLDEKEIYYIAQWHTYRYDELGNQGYNLTRGGQGNWKFETETLIQAFYDNNEHLTNTCKDIGCSEPTLIKALKSKGLYGKGAYMPIYQIDLKDGHIIKQYESEMAACKEHNLARNTLWCALNGEQKTANGYAWCYVNAIDTFKLEDRIDNKMRRVYCPELDLIFNSVKEAGMWIKEHNYSSSHNINSNICRASKTGIKAYGFHWQYA